ncbi:VanZ family protein [Paenibacillus rubinfantis]|jgi:glycopeptide antibiotics resistance protein|uniref:VanZ family protein n=1 Tax=Paenibacillus rubinfantis TaxID=1720296 RepID=UPI00073F295D|nr:VanZ family protein [Paenibacillus rubinfantis]
METESWLKYAGVRVLFVLYLGLLVKIILFKFHDFGFDVLWRQFEFSLNSPGLVYRRLQQGNLVPLKEITRSLEGMTPHDMVNVFGNVALFIPFGILLGVMFRQKGISSIETILYAFAVSLSLESAQLLLAMGQFDVDDLLLNTGGALLGYFMYLFLSTALGTQAFVRTGEG